MPISRTDEPTRSATQRTSVQPGVRTLHKPRRANDGRIPNLDVLKLIAVSAVLGIHVPESLTHRALPWQIANQLFRFAVPCFFLASGFFFMRSWRASSEKTRLLFRYGVRISIPFIFWALFYAIVPPFVTGAPNGVAVAIRDHLLNIVHYPHTFLLTGFVYHLWFLSSLGQALLILWLCLRFATVKLGVIVGTGLFVLALLGGPYAPTPVGLHFHFEMRTGPFFSTLFVAIGAWLAATGYRCSRVQAVVLLGFGLVLHFGEVLCLYLRYAQPISEHDFVVGTAPYSVGFMLWALAEPRLGQSPLWPKLGSFSLGIYAIHPYIIEVLIRTVGNSGVLQIPVIFQSMVLVCSVLATLCLAKIAWARPLVR